MRRTPVWPPGRTTRRQEQGHGGARPLASPAGWFPAGFCVTPRTQPSWERERDDLKAVGGGGRGMLVAMGGRQQAGALLYRVHVHVIGLWRWSGSFGFAMWNGAEGAERNGTWQAHRRRRRRRAAGGCPPVCWDGRRRLRAHYANPYAAHLIRTSSEAQCACGADGGSHEQVQVAQHVL